MLTDCPNRLKRLFSPYASLLTPNGGSRFARSPLVPHATDAIDAIDAMDAIDPMDQVVQTFATELRQRLGPRVRQMLLFGSRARGDSREGSDYDMLVVVDHRTPELRPIILDIESGLMDRYGVLVATILRSEDEWQRSQVFPLARNIIREGVAL